MILQALHRFYERKSDEGQMPKPGYWPQSVRFILILDVDGNLVDITDREKKTGKKTYLPPLETPLIPERQSNAAKMPGFIVDNTKFILGCHPAVNKPKYTESYRLRLAQCFQETGDLGIGALLKFLDQVQANTVPEEMLKHLLENKDPTVGFKMSGDFEFLWERPLVQQWYIQSLESDEAEDNAPEQANSPASLQTGQCLITGENPVPLARIHGKVGVGLISDKRAGIVDFNKRAFESYRKSQSYNAPTSKEAMLGYVSALKYLYAKDSDHKLRIPGTVISFWAERSPDFEKAFKGFFDVEETPEEAQKRKFSEEKEAITEAKSPYKAPNTGAMLSLERFHDDRTQFYVLGLSPNSARLSVRFWIQGSVSETAERIQAHFEDMAIVYPSFDSGILTLYRLLKSTALNNDIKNIPPRLGGELLCAVLQGTNYPQTLLQAVLIRIKAEHDITYPRAALIKAILNRKARLSAYSSNYPLLEVSMDENNSNVAYRLGRLFAILEHLQEKAHQKEKNDRSELNATIRDRFYGAASVTPVTVFPRLIKLSHHHLSKLEYGDRAWFSDLIGKVMTLPEDIQTFPKFLNLEEQGLFAIGYYHQKQWRYTKKEKPEKEKSETVSAERNLAHA